MERSYMQKKTTLKCIGFFRELPHGDPNGPSLVKSKREEAAENESQVIAYLSKGVPYIVSPGPVWDVIDNEGPIGTGSVLTDGEWAWPDDLVSYVSKYHVALPDDFIGHAVSNGWQVPDLSRAQLLALQLPPD
jgi:hypothetical protein